MASSVNHITTFLVILTLFVQNIHMGFVLGCHEMELQVLFKFKQGLFDPRYQLSSWKGKDCCKWSGVGCNNVTGYVNHLNISQQFYTTFVGHEVQMEQQFLAQELDPSLIELRQLNYLDLSGIDFQGSQIPGFIGSFQHLRHLYLSSTNFNKFLPPQLGNLTRLQSLSVSGEDDSFLHWLPGLVNLQYLDMSGSLINHPTKFMAAISKFPFLKDLRLHGCGLGNAPLFFNSTWISNIQHLDLSFNNIEGPLPRLFSNMTSLTYLDFSINLLNGPIPLLLRDMRKLDYLDVSSNLLSVEGGSIMGIAGNFRVFDFSYNSIEGELSGPCANLSKDYTPVLEELYLVECNVMGTLPYCLSDFRKLTKLDISFNKISGQIPVSIGNLSFLESLSLSDNSLSGRIPSSLGGLSSLQTLVSTQNFLNGSIPDSLGQLKKLVYIDLSSNLLEGVVSDSHLGNLSRLSTLRLSNNSLSLKLGPGWMPPFQLSELSMSNCKIVSELPKWIKSQRKLRMLDLSNTGISGELPKWFWKMSLDSIGLSHNHIRGPIGDLSYKLQILDLSYNSLSGFLPNSICQLSELSYLDLQSNDLSGAIPDCWVRWTSQQLMSINLSSNKLSGIIPQSIGVLVNLYFLNLNNNSLEGKIPHTFTMASKLKIMDLGENQVSGSIPGFSAKSHPSLQILRLRGNKLVGVIPEQLCSLSLVQVLDLAINNLTGEVPPCFADLSGMKLLPSTSTAPPSNIVFPDDESTTETLKGDELPYTSNLKFLVNLDLSCNGLVGSIPEAITNLSGLIGFNLSHNHLSGRIPENIGEMRSLESLDLSNNHLSGTIPSNLAALTSLSSLNLSNNQLDGQIPTGSQLQVLDYPSIYGGNPGLCGDPLPNKCGNTNGQQQQQEAQQEQESEKENVPEKALFYFVIFSGFATGFWGVVGSLLLKRRFRFTLFHLVSNISDYLYVQVMVRINRLKTLA